MSITQFPTPPSRNDAPDVFTSRADAFVAAFPDFVNEINPEITNINTKASQVAADTITVTNAKDAALAASNFAGAWADLTGALNVPAAVSHSGAVWLLLTDLADVTASEPSGANGDWEILPGVYSVEGDPGITIDTTDGVVTVTIDKATDAQLHGGTANKFVAAAEVYSANAPVTLTDGATITPDFKTGRVFSVTLGGNRTLANPTNQVAGQSGLIFVTQDATGGRTLSYGSDWKFSLSVPVLDIAPGAEEVISYYVKASGEIRCSFLEPFV